MSIKKLKEAKLKNKKIFTKKELKDILKLITNLKEKINDKRIQLNNINKESDEKIHKLFAQKIKSKLNIKKMKSLIKC